MFSVYILGLLLTKHISQTDKYIWFLSKHYHLSDYLVLSLRFAQLQGGGSTNNAYK